MRSVIVVTVFVDVVIIVTLCMSANLTVILAETLIGIICNDMLVFFLVCFSFRFPACSLSVNSSIGLIDVAYTDPLHCLWTIGNTGITNAVAVFIIQRVIISSCRYLELTELFSLGFSFSHLRARSSV